MATLKCLALPAHGAWAEGSQNTSDGPASADCQVAIALSTAGLMLTCLAFAKACVSPAQQPLILTPCAAVTATVDRHVDSATCRLRSAAGSGAGLGSGSGTLLAEVAGVEMTLAPRRPAAAKTTVTELLRWQPYGVRVDADAERLRYVCKLFLLR